MKIKNYLKHINSKLKMSKTVLCKLLQRKTYDVLSRKYTLLYLFMGFVVIFVATLHFGETLIEWSTEKYAVVFSPYSNNILRKSYRNMLCQYVPIDIVYTWVNGSDPEFLKELVKAKEEYGFLNPHKNCSYSNCVKSHMVLVRPQLPSSITLSDLEEIHPVFQHIAGTFVISSHQSSRGNITVLEFTDLQTADLVISKRMITFDGQNYTLNVAFVTENWGAHNTVLLKNMFILNKVPTGYSKDTILDKLPSSIKTSVLQVLSYEEKSLALVKLSDNEVLNSVMKMSNISFEKKFSGVSPAYLVIELLSEHEDISASRFTDNEELRYSLRSVEKYAPWVRHVYIITNGQIPYWLNLDSPMVTIVTHDEIFPNKSHLPTFSSPAIECHLHRIPNLSQKFIYLNDDVMFGKEVWPEDFYTHTKGQKVYLSWPVPNCADGCPPSWIRDGYCDKPCNNSQCQWDGGDCTADNPLLPYHASGIQMEGGVTSFYHIRKSKSYCNAECADTWLADRYCDKACNVEECGYDAGDCGLENFDRIPEVVLTEEQTEYSLPPGSINGYFNLTHFLRANYSLIEGFYGENPVVRAIAISLKYSVIAIVLNPKYNATKISIVLKGSKFAHYVSKYQKSIFLHVAPQRTIKVKEKDTSPQTTTEESFSFEKFNENIRFPVIDSTDHDKKLAFKYQNVNISASDLPYNITVALQHLQHLKDSGILTQKGFLKKKSQTIENYLRAFNFTEKVPILVTENDISSTEIIKLKSIDNINVVGSDVKNNTLKDSQTFDSTEPTKAKRLWNKLNNSIKTGFVKQSSDKKLNMLPKGPEFTTNGSLSHYFRQLNSIPKKEMNPTGRHLLDTFGDSLRHVNKLYYEAFGYESRKVPSHIAHFVDRDVMTRLTDRFDTAFDVTSSHKIRSSNDMQFSFSYYYYMMSEVTTVTIENIFDHFDIDNSGTWSDREIRTVLTRLYDIPLDYAIISTFEQLINNCSSPEATPESLPRERYYDSKLPDVTKSLIATCTEIKGRLLQHFGSHKKNLFEILGEEEVAFKMIHNNLTQALTQIDDLRKHPKKFVCLNDNMNHGTKEAEMIRAVIEDFYESMFPQQSQFELNQEYRNRFLYIKDLKEWRRLRNFIRIFTYCVLAILVLFSLYSFWIAERYGDKWPRWNLLQHKKSAVHSV